MKAALLLTVLMAAPIAAQADAAPTDADRIVSFGEVMTGLQRSWREDCSAGPIDAKVSVVFTLDNAGRLTGEPQATTDSKGPAAETAMARAIVAVKAAASFKTLPAMFLGKTYTVVFDGHVVCPTAR